ncbi:MAG: GNAT family N-acetyltransferase [Tunicatimonas sp.]
MAIDQNELCGFACTYAQHDRRWGALLDNLHVSDHWQGRGIGRALMRRSARWVQPRALPEGLYLWVFEANVAASAFYQRNGGVCQERAVVDNPGGGQAPVLRYIWPKLALLSGVG